MTANMHDEIAGPLVVRIGTQVDVESENGSSRTFKIVETYEADPKSGLISDQSPVGKALLGHQEGDSVSVATPGGVTNYTIRSIRPML
jgi:transcription elongation factor GreA